MSDHDTHLETIRGRADKLGEQLDDLIPATMSAEQTACEIGAADLGLPGELSATDHADLMCDLRRALCALRSAERVIELHRYEIKAQQAKTDRDK